LKIFALVGRLDLKSKIAIATVGLFTVAVWLLAHDLVEEVHANFEGVLAAQQLALVEHIADSLEEEAKLRISTLEDIARHTAPEILGNGEDLRAFLAGRHNPRLFNLGLMVIAADGTGLADYPTIDGRGHGAFAGEEYFDLAMSSGATAIGRPQKGRFTNAPVVVIATPLRDSGGKVVGVLAGVNRVSDSDFFTEIIPKQNGLGGEFHIIAPRDRMYVASTDSSRILQPVSERGVNLMLDRFVEGYQGSGVTADSTGVELLTSGMRMPSTGWQVIATMPTRIAFAPVNGIAREIYKDAALSMVVIAVILWLYLYRQLAPLDRAAAILDDMAGGQRPLQSLPLEGGREIRRLLDSFNRFQARITEQQRQLRDNAEQLRLSASVFDGTSEAILITDADNRILGVNKPFCQLTGYQESELIGQTPSLLKSNHHDRSFYAGMWAALESGGRWAGEIWNRRKNGEVFPERLNISTIYDAAGKVERRIAIAADITAEKNARELIWRQANYDLLTDLPNRRLLLDLLRGELAAAGREGQGVALCLVNLDRFKEINDTLGHTVGDRLLIETASRLAACVGDAATLGYLGSDEFVVAFRGPADMVYIDIVPVEVHRAIGLPYQLGIETIHVTASIGVTVFPADGDDVDSLLQAVEQATRAAKTSGGNRSVRFTEAMREDSRTRLQLATDLRGALAAGQLEVYYQPIVEMATGQCVKAEALLRWHHPQRGFVSPAQFIPIAEETGLIAEIGNWVFRQAAAMVKRWCAACEDYGDDGCVRAAGAPCRCQIAVNKSPRQFLAGSSQRDWLEHLRDEGIPPRCLAIEITEGLLLDSHDEVIDKLAIFRRAGIQVALDDFGTGYSAMSYLKRFDIDYLKIDQTFVRDMEEDPSDRAIVEAVIAMAHRLGMKVVAEGIETAGQRDLLAAAGCDYGQGYFFARPMPAADFAVAIGAGRALAPG